MKRSVVLVTLVMLLVASCTSSQRQALPFITIQKSFQPYDRSVFAPIQEPTLLVVAAPEEAAPLEGWLSPEDLQRVGALTNFATEFVLAWFWGERVNNFNVEIKRVVRADRDVTVYVDYRPRPPVALPLPSSAFHVVRAARPEDLKGNVLFTVLDVQTGEELAQVSHLFP